MNSTRFMAILITGMIIGAAENISSAEEIPDTEHGKIIPGKESTYSESEFMAIKDPDECKDTVLAAVKRMKGKSDDIEHAVFVAGNWIAFCYLPEQEAKPSKCFLVHTKHGVVKKRDYRLLGLFLKDLNIFSQNNTEGDIIYMVSFVLDNNPSISYGFQKSDWLNAPQIIINKDVAILDYWNHDTSNLHTSDFHFTHHVITITRDYKVTETRKTFDSSGNEIK